MNYFSIRLIAQSPLSIRSDHASEGAQMTNYIPGTTLIGSLATTYKLMYPDNSELFERLFLSGAISFPHLYPASYKEYKAFKDEEKLPDIDLDQPVYPIPKTALTCKRYKGFRYPQNSGNEGHGVRDTLITRAIFNEWVPASIANEISSLPKKVASLAALTAIKKCAACGEPAERYEGFYRRINKELPLLASDSHKHLQTHTGINRDSGTVEQGVLYNRQVFDEGTQFWGLVQITDAELVSPFEDFLAEISHTALVRIGTGRTRGMGKVALYVEVADQLQENVHSFQQRLDTFQTLLQTEAAKYQLAHIKEQYYFALTLHSPAILNDNLLRYRGTINAETITSLLSEQTGIAVAGLQQVYEQASLQRITGWQELWGTPKTNEYAIEAGSVFLFKCPIEQRTQLLEALYRLQEQGIGKRRLEGFGRIRISDAFHQEVTWL